MSLPSVPPPLKSVSAYIQRSNALTNQDPIVAYWCAYYAAQLGISMKLKDTESRKFLLSLLAALESMKQAIGPHDAIDDEAVSAAYIENFAIKVFASADAEDRRGEATRATAKKFLAAANFLELLRIFDKEKESTGAESPNDEKIRYAKWKAADIAKAFRLGQKPTPGPALAADADAGDDAAAAAPGFDVGIPPAIIRATSPPPALNLVPPSPDAHDNFRLTPGAPLHAGAGARAGGGLADVVSPSGWSTVATPGTPGRWAEDEQGESRRTPGRGRNAWVSGELEGREEEGEEEEVVEVETVLGNRSHTGEEAYGAEGHASSPPAFPPVPLESEYIHISSSPPADPYSLPSVPPPPGSGSSIHTHIDAFTPSLPSPPQSFAPPPPAPPTLYSPPTSPPPSSHIHVPHAPHPVPVVPPVPPPFVPTAAAAAAAAVVVPPPIPVPLTPQAIARVQRHARFAISALDYEDVEQARKELRAALQMLGG